MIVQNATAAQTTVQAPVAGTSAPTAWQMLEAQRAYRSELRNQQSRLNSQRRDVVRDMDRANSSAEREGLQGRLKELDARIADLDKQLAVADQQVAQAAAVPGAVPPPRPPVQRNGPPEEVFILGMVFTVFVMMPLAVGFARRLWKKSATAMMEIPAELSQRLTRLEHAVDAVAVELERVGEGQRFVTKVLGEGSMHRAEPLALPDREAIHRR